MRWTVEINPVGRGRVDLRFCLEARYWKGALEQARKLHLDETLSGLSIDATGDGAVAVDSGRQMVYRVERAPDDELVTASRDEAARAASRTNPPPSTANPSATLDFSSRGEVVAGIGSPRSRKTPSPSTPPKTPSKPPKSMGSRAVSSAPKPNTPDGPPTERVFDKIATSRAKSDSVAQTTKGTEFMEPDYKQISARRLDPSANKPLTKIERVYALNGPLAIKSIEAFLERRLRDVKLELDQERGVVVHLALFEHTFKGAPDRPPVGTLEWRQWRTTAQFNLMPDRGVVLKDAADAANLLGVSVVGPVESSLPPAAAVDDLAKTNVLDAGPKRAKLDAGVADEQTNLVDEKTKVAADAAKVDDLAVTNAQPPKDDQATTSVAVRDFTGAASGQASAKVAAMPAGTKKASATILGGSAAAAMSKAAKEATIKSEPPKKTSTKTVIGGSSKDAISHDPLGDALKKVRASAPPPAKSEAPAKIQDEQTVTTDSTDSIGVVRTIAIGEASPQEASPQEAAPKKTDPIASDDADVEEEPPTVTKDALKKMFKTQVVGTSAKVQSVAPPKPASEADAASDKIEPTAVASITAGSKVEVKSVPPEAVRPSAAPVSIVPTVTREARDEEHSAFLDEARRSGVQSAITGARVESEDLVTELFEVMGDLTYLPTALDGAHFILQALLERLPCEMGLLSLFDPSKEDYVVVAQIGGSKSVVLERFPADKDLAGQVTSSGNVEIVGGKDCPSQARFRNSGTSLTSLASAPIQRQGRYLGLLEVANPLDGKPITAADANGITYTTEQLGEFLDGKDMLIDPAAVLRRARLAAKQ